MIDRVECSANVEERKKSDVTFVDCGTDVRHDTQESRFRRVEFPKARLEFREQIILNKYYSRFQIAQISAVPCRVVQHNKEQHNIALHSVAQWSAVKYILSTVQHTTVQ